MVEFIISILTLLIPVSLFLLGLHYKNKGPGRINRFIGYRTTMSMKNADTWIFANRRMGEIFTKLGLFSSLGTLLILIITLFINSTIFDIAVVIMACVQTIMVILVFVRIEKELKNNFDKNGNRKIN